MDGVEAPNRDEQPRHATDQAENRAFDQHQPHQTPAACAHRGPHRQLFAAGERARELQIGDVGAGDEEHAADGDEEEVQIFPVIADDGFEQLARINGAAGIGGGITPGQLMRDIVEVGPRLGQRHTRSQTAEGEKPG